MQTALPRTFVPEPDQVLAELRSLGFGQTLGRYTLLRRIAAGGMAEVYLARSRSASALGKRVAIKKILPQLSHNERFVEMLADEAKITVCLAHPNIAQVYELASDGDYFIVMELVDGPPLSRLISRAGENGIHGLPVELAVHVVSEVAKGLDHAHRQTDTQGAALGIIHRDVSPQNILISQGGAVKLIDFGIARAVGRVAKTAHGVIKGKLRYLAPEIANGEEPDWRADIYCCGIVLFEALTGTPMFSPTSDVEAIAMAAAGSVRSPRSINPQISEELERIVMRAVAKDRRDRYQSGNELAHELRMYLSRMYPQFEEGALSDFVTQMFASELENEKKLDLCAEKHLPPLTAIEQRPALAVTGTFEELATELPVDLTFDIVEAEAPTRVRKSHADIQSQLTDLGSLDDDLIEFTDTSMPDDDGDAQLYEPSAAGFLDVPEAEELSFSEEIELIEDTAPSLPRINDFRVEDVLTEWKPKRFRAWRTKVGNWTIGQVVAGLCCFVIGGVALGVVFDSRDSDEPAIVIPATPTHVETRELTRAVVPVLPAVEIPLGELDEEEDADVAPEVAPEPARGKLGVLRIKSFPAAAILVDGKKRGTTPKTLNLKPGSHKIVLQNAGGDTREISRWVGRGKNIPITIYW